MKIFTILFVAFLLAKPTFSQFSTPIELESAEAWTQLELHDMNGDGVKDLVFQVYNNYYFHTIDKGQLSKQAQFLLFADAPFSRLVDFDSDGDVDVIGCEGGQLFWYQHLDGKGNFAARQPLVNFYKAFKNVSAADLDADGDMDLTAGCASDTLFWFANSGDNANFQTRKIPMEDPWYDRQINVGEVRIFDDNSDGLLDIYATSSGWPACGDQVSYLCQNLGNGKFQSPANVWYCGNNYSPGFTGDLSLSNIGKAPLLVITGSHSITNGSESTSLVLKKGLGAGSSTSIGNLLYHSWASGKKLVLHKSAGLLDWDKDGDLDALVNCHEQLIFAKNEAGKYSTQIVYEDYDPSGFMGPTSGVASMLVIDFDQDGNDDIITMANGRMVWLRNLYQRGSTIEGVIFLDENENQIHDASEPLIFDQSVHLNYYLVNTGMEGSFSFNLLGGSLQLSCTADDRWAFTTPAEYSILSLSDTVFQLNFGLKPKFKKSLKSSIDLTAAPMLCNAEVPHWLTAQNLGNVRADGLISLKMDSLAHFESAEPMPDSTAGDIYFWKFKGLSPTHRHMIKLILKTEHAVQQPPVFVNLRPKLQVSKTEDASQMHFSKYQLVTQIDCFASNNAVVAYPNLFSSNNYVLPKQEIQYTIQFQNQSQSTIEKLMLVDSFDSDILLSSFRVIGSSHPFKVRFDLQGRAFFTFENINLPPAKMDKIGSQGFVKMAVKVNPVLSGDGWVLHHSKAIADGNPVFIFPSTYSHRLESKHITTWFYKPCLGSSNGRIYSYNYFKNDSYLNYDWFALGTGKTKIENLPTGKYPLKISHKLYDFGVLDTVFDLSTAWPLPNFEPYFKRTEPGKSIGIAGVNILPPAQYNPKFLWNTNPPQTTKEIKNLPVGQYTVTITRPDYGCTTSTTIGIDDGSIHSGGGGKFDKPTASNDLLEAVESFEIAPNPARDLVQIRLQLNEPADWQIEVFRADGSKFKTFDARNSQNLATQILLENPPSGLLLVVLKIGDQFFTQKLVVEN